MQLGRRPSPTSARDLAAALGETTALAGDRPAYTILRGSRREEQGFRTFAQWVAKGAHLLQVDFAVEPGDRVHLDSPASWSAAAVACAAWWVGACVTPQPRGSAVSIVHERRAGGETSASGDLLWLGDSLDGGPEDTALASWAAEVVVFPDTPPPPRSAPDALAFVDDVGAIDQAGLIHAARSLGDGSQQQGVVGIRWADVPVGAWLAALTRPVVTGLATVIVDGADEAAVDREPLDWWLAQPGSGGADTTASGT